MVILWKGCHYIYSVKKIESVSASLDNFAEIFNGIQTSAERPKPIYWFSAEEIIVEDDKTRIANSVIPILKNYVRAL